MNVAPKSLDLNAILQSLKSNDNFIMGLYDLFSFCSIARLEDIESCQQFLMNCLFIIKNNFYIRAGNGKLDAFMPIIRNCFGNVFNAGSPSCSYVSSIMQAIGYEQGQQTVQTGSPLKRPSHTSTSPNPLHNYSQPSQNFHQQRIQTAASLVLNDASGQLQHPSPSVLGSHGFQGGCLINPPSNAVGPIQTAQHAAQNAVNCAQTQDLLVMHQPHQQQGKLSQNATPESAWMPSEGDINGYNLQLLQQSQQSNVIPNVMSIPTQVVNVPHMGQVNFVRHPQVFSYIPNSDEMIGMPQMSQRFPNQPMVNSQQRLSSNNVVYLAGQYNRPVANILSSSQSQQQQQQQFYSNVNNSFVYSQQPNIVNVQNISAGVRRQVTPQPLMSVPSIRMIPSNLQNTFIRGPNMVVVPNYSGTIPQHLMTQVANGQGMGAFDQNQEVIGSVPSASNVAWQQGAAINIPQQLQKNLREPMMLNQQMPFQILQNNSLIHHGGAVPPHTVIRTTNSGSYLPQNLPYNERSPSQSRQSSTVTIQTVSRPVSDSSKPSTMHYHPSSNDIPDSFKASNDRGSETIVAPDNESAISLRDQEEQSSDALITHSQHGIGAVVGDFPPLRSNSKLSSSQTERDDSYSEVSFPPCTIRLCSWIPSCDSTPSMALVEQALGRMRNDISIIVSVPNSTFLDLEALRQDNDYLFSVSKRFTIRKLIYDTLTIRNHLDVQFKCLKKNVSVNTWPQNMVAKLNGATLIVKRDELLGYESILVKDMLNKDDNLLEIEANIPGEKSDGKSDQSDRPSYKFGMNLVLRSNVSVMLRSLVNKRTLNIDKSIENIKTYFDDNVIEMARGYTVISLICPLSNNRVVIPARGERCKHIQCLDCEALLTYNCNRTHFLCPICRVETSTQALIIDGYLCTLVALTNDLKDVSEVRINPECVWDVVSSSHSSANKPLFSSLTQQGAITSVTPASSDVHNPSSKPVASQNKPDFIGGDLSSLFDPSTSMSILDILSKDIHPQDLSNISLLKTFDSPAGVCGPQKQSQGGGNSVKPNDPKLDVFSKSAADLGSAPKRDDLNFACSNPDVFLSSSYGTQKNLCVSGALTSSPLTQAVSTSANDNLNTSSRTSLMMRHGSDVADICVLNRRSSFYADLSDNDDLMLHQCDHISDVIHPTPFPSATGVDSRPDASTMWDPISQLLVDENDLRSDNLYNLSNPENYQMTDVNNRTFGNS